MSLRFNRVSMGSPTASAIGVSASPVALSTADVSLIDHSLARFTPYTLTEHKFDLIIQGGAHLVVPTTGMYSATLAFSLYNDNNELVSTSNVVTSFTISNQVNTGYTIQLQNAADLVSLAFSTPSDLVNGVSVKKPAGLRITGYKAYQVYVKTTTSNLTSGGTGILPSSIIKISADATTNTGTIVCTPRSLSAADQIIITNPLTDARYQTTQYNLKYSTDPRDERMISIPPGTYTTNVVFVVIPQ